MTNKNDNTDSEDYLILIKKLYPNIDKALNLLNLCNQDKIWITKDKKIINLSDIKISHAKNLIKWLNKRSKWIKIASLVEAEFDLIRHNGGELAHDSLEYIVYELEDKDSNEILIEMPLYKSLLRRIKEQ